MWLRDFTEAQRLLAWQLGLSRQIPDIAKVIHLGTTTYYPDANPETTTVDGYVRRGAVDQTFANIRAGAGTASGDTDTNVDMRLDASTTTDQFALLDRHIILFDASSIPDTDVISTATLSAFGQSKANAIGSPDYHIAASTPASNTALVYADFSQVQTTSFGSITYANWSTSAYNDVVLNASGISNISVTDISKFSSQLSWDINASFTGTWSSAANSLFGEYFADQTGTTNDPRLTVIVTEGSGLQSKYW